MIHLKEGRKEGKKVDRGGQSDFEQVQGNAKLRVEGKKAKDRYKSGQYSDR